jgi:hypothetical protein
MPIGGPQCKAKVRTECGFSGEYIEPGRVGKVLATRTKEAVALVKWKGKGGASQHPLEDLELIR